MSKTIIFKVGMTCGGCSGAVSKILSKIDGVNEVDANVDTKLVKVVCQDDVDDNTLMTALTKWSQVSGKSVEQVH